MIKKIIGFMLIVITIWFYATDFINKEVESMAFNIKTGNYTTVYNTAFSTILFDKYSYSKYANNTLAYFYMFAFENVVKQNFQLSEEYCLMAKEKCSIEWLYKEAVSYYCQSNIVEYPAWSYISDNQENFKEKCNFSIQRWNEIKQKGKKAYNLPTLYWLPKIR